MNSWSSTIFFWETKWRNTLLTLLPNTIKNDVYKLDCDDKGKDHFIKLNRSLAEAAHSFSILELSSDLFSIRTASCLSTILLNWAASKVSGIKTKSLVFVFNAESSPFSFFKATNYRNFLGRITESTYYLTLIGTILAPLMNKSLT